MLLENSNRLNIWLLIFATLRIFSVLIPQTGYIHPDEYFQSVEVLVGKVFDVENSPPWEFNTTFPIRSMTIPYLTTGLCYIFLREFNELAMAYFSTNIVTPYFLLIIPRFLICVFSFMVDFCLYKICLNNNENYKTRLTVLSTSYVMVVYGTRTFTNAIELILFSVLLYFVCESQTFSNELTRKRDYINYRYEHSKNIVEKVKFHKLRLYLTSDSYRNCFIISTLSVLGFFNRPTFLAFAVIPVFFWIYRGTGNKSPTVIQFHTRILFFALCSLPCFIIFIIIDSFYYGYVTWGEMGMLDISINNFVFTPLNFLKYNLNNKNLAKHGLHPRILHLLVNVPLLFNVLGILAIYTLGQYAYLCFKRKFISLPSIRSIKCLMTVSFLTPVLILSIFPHQEPRFLIPIILPLVYLHGARVLPEPDNIIAKIPEGSIQETKNNINTLKNNSYNLFKFWLFLNVILLIFYGFVHQGGVYPATAYLEKDIKYSVLKTEFHIITSNIYSLPESFLLQKASKKFYSAKNIKYTVSKRVFLYEEGSKDLTFLAKQLKSMVEAKETLRKNTRHTKIYKIYLLISSSLNTQIENILRENSLKFNKIDSFWPHISMEAFPDLTHYCLETTSIFYESCDVLPLYDYFIKILDTFQLSLYELDFKVESIISNNQNTAI